MQVAVNDSGLLEIQRSHCEDAVDAVMENAVRRFQAFGDAINMSKRMLAHVAEGRHVDGKHLVEAYEQEELRLQSESVTRELRVQPGLDVSQMDVGDDALQVFQDMSVMIQPSYTFSTMELLKLRSDTIQTCMCDG